MTTLILLLLVLGVLGMFNGPSGVEAHGFAIGRVSDTRGVSGLEPKFWLTAEYLKGHLENEQGFRFGVCAGGHICSDWGGHHNTMAVVDTQIPMNTRIWEFTPPPEYILANFMQFNEERQRWTARHSQQGHRRDLPARMELPTHEFKLHFGEYGPLVGHQTGHEGAQEEAGAMQRLPANTYRINWSDGRKHRTKRSCVLRRIHRFLQRFRTITGRGLLGEVIRAAGGLQGNLLLYRIPANPAGAEGVGINFRAGTRNWTPEPSGETRLGAETLSGREVLPGGITGGTGHSRWNGVPGGETDNFSPSDDGLRGDSSSNIGSADRFYGA